MSTRQVKARFEFTGGLMKNKHMQNRVIRCFLKQRGLLVDILNNGILDYLNKEFDATHELYEDIYYDEVYMKFMQEGQQKWADIVNKHADENLGVNLFIDEEGAIYGKTTNYISRSPVEIHMYID